MTHFEQLRARMKTLEEEARAKVRQMDPPPEDEWRAIAWSLSAELAIRESMEEQR